MKKILGFVSLASLGSMAHAAADPAFTAAITTVSADILLYAGALVGVAAVGVSLAIAMKYVKRIRSAA